MKTKKNFYWVVLFVMLLALFLLTDDLMGHAYNSKAWQELLSARTATLWVEGQSLGDGVILNARGELNVTWLERGLSRILSTDKDVDEWIVNGLNYYFSNRKETRAKLKRRDVFVLNYRAIKNWSFNPAKLVVNGYTITLEDILTRKIYWEGELTPGSVGTVAVVAPSLKPGQTVELRYEDASGKLEIPRIGAR